MVRNRCSTVSIGEFGSVPGTISVLPSSSAGLLLQSGCVLILVSDYVESSVPKAGTRKLFICMPKVR